MRADGRLSTRRSRNTWDSVSIQDRFSTTRSRGWIWLARSSRRVQASRVRWRRCDGSRACQDGSSTGTSRSVSTAGRIGPRLSSSVPSVSRTLARIVCGSSRVQLEVSLEQVENREVRGIFSVGDRAAFEDQPVVGALRLRQLIAQAGFADTRLSDDAYYLPMTLCDLHEEVVQ